MLSISSALSAASGRHRASGPVVTKTHGATSRADFEDAAARLLRVDAARDARRLTGLCDLGGARLERASLFAGLDDDAEASDGRSSRLAASIGAAPAPPSRSMSSALRQTPGCRLGVGLLERARTVSLSNGMSDSMRTADVSRRPRNGAGRAKSSGTAARTSIVARCPHCARSAARFAIGLSERARLVLAAADPLQRRAVIYLRRLGLGEHGVVAEEHPLCTRHLFCAMCGCTPLPERRCADVSIFIGLIVVLSRRRVGGLGNMILS